MALRANPGGNLAPEQVFGRDALIQHLWSVLNRQSLLLTAERRMGKTSIIKKMVAEPPFEGLFFYQDLEGHETELEFVEAVLCAVDQELSQRQRAVTKVRELISLLGGAQVGDIKLPNGKPVDWKHLLDTAIEDLLEQHPGPVVFFWDEIPLMLHTLAKRQGDRVAMRVLDHLRALRQRHDRLRMVFTGSIGLHNVMTSLRRAGHANDATNDMYIQEVPPLPHAAAVALATQLLFGERIETTDHEAVATAIATAVDGMPYFIHHVVDDLKQTKCIASPTTVHDIVTHRLTHAHDPWHLRYYRERLATYYTPDECRFALAILDALAPADKPISLLELCNRVMATETAETDECIRDVIVLLQQDHYVHQRSDGTYGFRFPLIARFWRLHRGLLV